MTTPPNSEDPEASGRLLFALALLAGALLRLIQLGNPDLFSVDEGMWAVGARNIVEGGMDQLLGLSRTPLGPPSGTPILFPATLSLMVRIFGPVEWAIRIPSAFAGLFSALLLERVVRRGFGQPAGHLAGAFAALFPPLVAASRTATVEPMLTALGLMGIIFGIRALEEDLSRDAVLSGIAFGLGFLTKGYAIGLFMAPLVAALLFRPGVLKLGRTTRAIRYFAVAFVLVGGSQLLFTALLRPALVAFQFRRSFGVAEAGPWAFDPGLMGAELKAIVRTLGLFFPLIGAGVAFLLRPVKEREIESGATGGERRLSHGALWTVYAIELVLLVAVNGNFHLSSASVIPVLAAFAGFGATALFVPLRERMTARTETRLTLISGALALLAAAVLFEIGNVRIERGGDRTFGLPVVLAGIAVATLASALLAWGVRAPRGNGRITLAFVAAFLVFAGFESARVIRKGLLTHRTGSREVADQIEPLVAELPPRAMAFRIPDPDALAFRLFRTGLSWNGITSPAVLQQEMSEGTLRCWAYREEALAGDFAPPAELRTWLQTHAREVTSEVDARAGRHTGLRVFVPPPA